MPGEIKILWVDDEMAHLKAHLFFLRDRGFEVSTATNGVDALEQIAQTAFDLVLLDEHMPGISGLETLQQIKVLRPELPVVMITKSEEEDIMDQAIGSKIADYIIKPVNPNQILSSIKRTLDRNRLVSQATTQAYQTSFQNLTRKIETCKNHSDWIEVYQQLVFWELELQEAGNGLDEVLQAQKRDANRMFFKYIQVQYPLWMQHQDGPLLSNRLMKERIFPLLDGGAKVCMILLDNFRYDQWLMIRKELARDFNFQEELYYSILPTSTQYARNAIFSGLMPLQMQQLHPELWNASGEQSLNAHEALFLQYQFARYHRNERVGYAKVSDSDTGRKILDHLPEYLVNDFNALVFNFIDMLSHARSELKMIKELATDESAFRGMTLNWFVHSTLLELFKELGRRQVKIVLTTDHGTIRVNKPRQIAADRDVNSNLRFKVGRKVQSNPKMVMEVNRPELLGLPSPYLVTTYLFAGNDDFFVYPNQYHHFSAYYKDTFQHGGISMEEMIVPLVLLEPR